MAKLPVRARTPNIKLPSAKSVVLPKTAPAKIVPPPILNTEQSLKEFATKPVVRPPKVSNKSLTKPLKSYLP